MANGFYYNGTTSTIETTGSLNVQAFGATGSLLGTASWAISASHTLTASYVNPLRQDIEITGSSFKITGSSFFGVQNLIMILNEQTSSYYQMYYDSSSGQFFYYNPDPILRVSTGYNNFVNSIFNTYNNQIISAGAFTTWKTTITQNRVSSIDRSGDVTPTSSISGSSVIFNPGTGFNNQAGNVMLTSNGLIGMSIGSSAVNTTTYSGSAIQGKGIVFLNQNGTLNKTSSVLSDAVVRFFETPDGGFVIGTFGAGTYTGTAVNCAVRLNSDLTLNTAFNTNIVSTGTTWNALGGDTGVQILPDGKLFWYDASNPTLPSAGWGTTAGADRRVLFTNADGTVNATAMTNVGVGLNGQNNRLGYTTIPVAPNPAIPSVYTILLGGYDGRIAGWGATPFTEEIFRVNQDGTLDNTFTRLSITSGRCLGGAYDENLGLYWVCGDFTQINGISYNSIVCFDYNGNINSSFAIGTGFTGGCNAISLDKTNQRILCSGNFTAYNGVSLGRIALLDYNGNLLSL